MSPTININEDLHKEISSYGNRDESYNTILARLLNHVDEEEAELDRKYRDTVFEADDADASGNPAVEQLADGTKVRFRIERGDYSGEEKFGTVQGSRIEYDGDKWSPTGMAREADKDIRGSDARDSGAYSGPREIEYQNDSGEWVSLNTVTE